VAEVPRAAAAARKNNVPPQAIFSSQWAVIAELRRKYAARRDKLRRKIQKRAACSNLLLLQLDSSLKVDNLLLQRAVCGTAFLPPRYVSVIFAGQRRWY